MANAPAKPAEGEDVAPVGKSKKKLIIMIIGALLFLGIIGLGATMFLSKKSGGADKEHKTEPSHPPVFLPLESFVVNLQSETGDKYLQVNMTLQVPDEAQLNLLKANAPQVRSRLLMLLSSKDASEILTPEGKEKLIQEIMTQVNLPFSQHGEAQKVSGVFFTSFVVQ